MKRRFCRWLYRHELGRLAQMISPSTYWSIYLDEVTKAFLSKFEHSLNLTMQRELDDMRKAKSDKSKRPTSYAHRRKRRST